MQPCPRLQRLSDLPRLLPRQRILYLCLPSSGRVRRNPAIRGLVPEPEALHYRELGGFRYVRTIFRRRASACSDSFLQINWRWSLCQASGSPLTNRRGQAVGSSQSGVPALRGPRVQEPRQPGASQSYSIPESQSIAAFHAGRSAHGSVARRLRQAKSKSHQIESNNSSARSSCELSIVLYNESRFAISCQGCS